jgi:hypothetical protein
LLLLLLLLLLPMPPVLLPQTFMLLASRTFWNAAFIAATAVALLSGTYPANSDGPV